jgi:uncharacterized protein (DUF427 family)
MRPTSDTGTPAVESVWDYPRPPRIEQTTKRIVVVFADVVLADTVRAIKYMETSHPPTYYIPLEDIAPNVLTESDRVTVCEYKGAARYVTAEVDGHRSEDCGWYYPTPRLEYGALAGHIAFYASRVDECFVDGEPVTPQPGEFYGGWITRDLVGPFKGAPGTLGW